MVSCYRIQKMSRTLVIQLSRLGDVIQTTPLLAELVRHEPAGSVDALVLQGNRFVLDHLALGGVYTVNRPTPAVVEINRKLLEGLRACLVPAEAREIWRELGLPRYERVLSCCYSPLACWLTNEIAAENRAGGIVNEHGEMLYCHDAHVYIAALDFFRLQNWFNLVDIWRATAPVVYPPAADARPHLPLAREVPFPLPAGTIVALNPGASQAQRRWPPGDFARLAQALASRGLIPMLLGAPADREICQAVQNACPMPVEAYCDLSVPEMAKLLSLSALLVSNDTGAVHIAAAAGCRSLGLFGGSAYFAETAPWGGGHWILQGKLGSPGVDLPPEVVLGAVLNRLGLADGETLRHELTDQGVTGWETFFLPPDSDPLGGICYRPVHAVSLGREEAFTRALRRLFAENFRARDTEHLRWNRPGSSSAESSCELARALTPFLTTLEQFAERLARCQSLCDAPDAAVVAEIHRTIEDVVRETEALKAAAESQPAVKPVIHFLDWQCRMMPPLPPRETFAFHEREFRRAACILCRAMDSLSKEK